MKKTTYSRWFCVIAFFAIIPSLYADEPAPSASRNPFYVYQNGLNGLSFDEQSKLLKDLGYDGIEYEGALQRIPEMLKSLDANSVKMVVLYVGANVDSGKSPYDPELKTAIAQLKGRGTTIALYLQGGKSSSSDSDDRAVAIVREIAGMAEMSGLRVSLYPHVGFYIARVEDSVCLAKKIDCKNVGVTFNLCHFLKQDDEKNLEVSLQEASPYLFLVSISGADDGNTQAMDWNRLIQPLDAGSFDVSRVVKTLERLNYRGPVGLQCYAIPLTPRENLSRAMKTWNALHANKPVR
jgi:sugar phosphate isomerase/epimerase